MTTQAKKVRVLIVDDSLFMRAAIAKTLSAGPFEVVGQAKDGKSALAEIARLAPDVVTMDFNMPGMNGADTVRQVMATRPTPVVMFSAHTKQGARETFDALAAGAVDFVAKPSGEVSVDLSKIGEELRGKLIEAASAKPRAAARPLPAPRSSSSAEHAEDPARRPAHDAGRGAAAAGGDRRVDRRPGRAVGGHPVAARRSALRGDRRPAHAGPLHRRARGAARRREQRQGPRGASRRPADAGRGVDRARRPPPRARRHRDVRRSPMARWSTAAAPRRTSRCCRRRGCTDAGQ